MTKKPSKIKLNLIRFTTACEYAADVHCDVEAIEHYFVKIATAKIVMFLLFTRGWDGVYYKYLFKLWLLAT